MVINHNTNALNTYRRITKNSARTNKAMEKLSSGLRINKAGDDAAGLAISEKMRGHIRGLQQASRNIHDAMSLIQSAEGGLSEVHSILQRGRELSVQANNDTLTAQDKNAVQSEINQLLMEVEKISGDTQFNNLNLLNQTAVSNDIVSQNIINGLKSGWLDEAENLIETYYGLTASTRDLNVVIQEGTPGGTLAAVHQTWRIDGGGNATLSSLTLVIDKVDFTPSTGADGTNSETEAGIEMYDDRILAHELTHAIMADQLGNSYYDAPTWFKEGTAEFIPGADERLKIDIYNEGGNVQAIVDRGADLINGVLDWDSTAPEDLSKNYSAAYLAVKYLNSQLPTLNFSMTDLMDDIQGGANVAAAIKNRTGIDDFAASFKANGAAYYTSLDIQSVGVAEIDTGSIMGSDHLGSALNAQAVIQTGTYSENPTNFNIIFPNLVKSRGKLLVQIGPNGGNTMEINLVDVRTETLGISDVNVTTNPGQAIAKFDDAIKTVSRHRSAFGAIQNRLVHAISISSNSAENLQAAESRIRDVDMAKEMMEFSKTNILSQAAQAMLVQAQQQPQGVLQLLR